MVIDLVVPTSWDRRAVAVHRQVTTGTWKELFQIWRSCWAMSTTQHAITTWEILRPKCAGRTPFLFPFSRAEPLGPSSFQYMSNERQDLLNFCYPSLVRENQRPFVGLSLMTPSSAKQRFLWRLGLTIALEDKGLLQTCAWRLMSSNNSPTTVTKNIHEN